MRQISLKNYIIYLFIILITIVLSLYIVILFNNSKRYYEENSVLTDILFELLLQENLDVNENFNNYLFENRELIIYISSGSDKNIKDFEKEFKEFIVSEKLQHDIVYINSDNISDNNFYMELIDNYGGTEQIKNYSIKYKSPMIIIFKDGYINDIYNQENFSVYGIKWFLTENGVVIND